VLKTHQSVFDSQTQLQEAKMKFAVSLLIVAAFCAVAMARPSQDTNSVETKSVESNESDLPRVRRDLSRETNSVETKSVESNESDLPRVRRDLSHETKSVESKSDERN
jgi:Ni/Co efflux regulator RcnB